MYLQTVSNHPVHILNNDGGFSPSSFIPFCSFGEEFIGANISEFEIPVCDIFKPTKYYDQLCYETDLQMLRDSKDENLMNQLELGLTLALDFNEERQFFVSRNISTEFKTFKNNFNEENSFGIYLNTISDFNKTRQVF